MPAMENYFVCSLFSAKRLTHQHSNCSTESSLLEDDSTYHLEHTESMETTSNSTPALSLRDPLYYPSLNRYLGSVLIGIVFLVGIVGNSLVVVVVTRSQSMLTPTNCYLVSLAVADVLLLVSAALPTIVEYHLIVDQHAFGSAACSAMVFTQYLGVNLSSLSITAFTVERYIAICDPIRAQTMCTVGRAKRIILVLWAFGLSYCGPWLGLAKIVSVQLSDGRSIDTCTFTFPRNYYLAYYLADLIIFYVVPLVTACILYGLIGVTLYSSSRLGSDGGAMQRRSTAKLTRSGSSSPTGNSDARSAAKHPVAAFASCTGSGAGTFSTLAVPGSERRCGNAASGGRYMGERKDAKETADDGVGGGEAGLCRPNEKTRLRKCLAKTFAPNESPKLRTKRSNSVQNIATSRIQVVKMLAVVVAMFASLWLPYRFYVVYNSFATRRFENYGFLLFCRLSVYINSAINPILYNAMSVKFRQAFRRLLCSCGRSAMRTTDMEAIGKNSSASDDGKRQLVVVTFEGRTSEEVKVKVILNGPPSAAKP